MQDLRKTFGRLLAANRKKAGLTQEALAASADMSVDMISRIEAGATGVRFASIAKLATALNIDPANFFTPDLPGGPRDRPAMNQVLSKLDDLADAELVWVADVLDAMLKRPGRAR